MHDLKEFWHVGRELPPGHRYRRYMPDNLWIDGIEGFRETTLALWEAFDAMGRELLSAIALHLASRRGGSTTRSRKVTACCASSTTRRSATAVEPSAGRARGHQRHHAAAGRRGGGLQVLDRDGRWLDINPARAPWCATSATCSSD